MADVKVDQCSVHMTEVTLNEINRAVKEAKDKGATKVTVVSPYSKTNFVIDVAVESNMMESLGYSATSFTMPITGDQEAIKVEPHEKG